MDYEDYGYYRRSFEQTYRCYPVSLINKQHLENGDKILMPQSALHCLASLHIDYPMLFELYNPSAKRVSHCGVLEFTAEEGVIYLPYWMMQNLLLKEGSIVQMKNATLPKGSFVKLQPHTKDFLDISNPKAILEKTLRCFSCLTIGDTIMVAYNNKNYYIDIVETKPSSAISIIETDCEVDFAAPLDYKEPEKGSPSIAPSKEPAQVKEAPAKAGPVFSSFTGLGRRLDGKPLQPPVASASSAPTQLRNVHANGIGTTSTSNLSSQLSGKLVFGSNTSKAPNRMETEKVSASPQPPKEEEPKFTAFTGRRYSLKD